MKKLALFVSLIVFCFSFAFAGCSSRRVHIDGVTVTSNKPSFETGNMFEAEDIKEYYSINNAMYVLLDSPFVGKNSVFIKKMGKDIVITSAGTYILKGTLNGRVVVDAGVEDKIKLVFAGVVINSPNGVALNIISAKKVILTLAAETVNELSAINYEYITDFGSVLRSTCHLTINGEGSLNIIAPNGDGVECDKTLKLVNGKISIKAEADGIEVKESVRFKNSALTIEAEKDGVNVKNKEDNKLGFVYVENGTFDIKSGDDCISASSNLRIDNGIFNLFAGKESTKNNTSQKALKADTGIIINNGNFVINSVGDGIHSDDSISIFDGKFVIETSDDAVHSDAKLLVAGGEFNILNCYEGLEGLTLEILDGDIDIYSLDDAINTKEPPNGVADGINRDIIISGGSITIRSDVDGIDSGGNIYISGGDISVCCPSLTHTAIVDFVGVCVVSGGTFFATGVFSVGGAFQNSEQAYLYAYLTQQNAGETVRISTRSGEVLKEVVAGGVVKLVVYSSGKLIRGKEYVVACGNDSTIVQAL